MDEICNQGLCILADTGSSLPASTIPPAAPTAPTTTPQAPPKTPETSAPIVQEPAQVPIQPAPVPSANIPVKEAETNTALSSEIQPPVLPADGQALKCTKATQHIDCSVGFACSEASLTCFEECKNSVGCQPGFSCFDSFCNIDFLDCKSDKDCPLGMFCSAMYEICQQCDDQHACANVKFTCDPLGVCYDSASASVDYGSSDDDSSGEEEGAGFDESSAGFVDSGYEDYGFDDGSGEYDDGSGYPPLDAGMLPDDGLPADGLPADAGLDQGLTTDGYTDTGYDSSAAGYDSSQDSSTQDPSQDYQSGYTDSALNQQGTSGQDQGQSANANLLLGQAGAGAGTSTTTDEQGLGALWWGLILFVTLGMVSGMAVLANKRVDFKNISLKNLFSKHAPAAGSASNMLSGQQPLDAASPSLTQPKIMQETSASANFTSPLQTSPQYPSSTNVSPEQKIDPYIEQQFTSYVESHINAGATKDQLYGLFIRAGWDKKTLDYLFDKHCLLFITPEERQQIENYIRFYVGKGLSRDSIRQGLVNAGWDQRVIEELMKEY
jgi:hypothetical protein